MTDQETGKTLPSRSEVPADMKWRLEDIYPDNNAWETEFNEVKSLLTQVEGYRGKLAESAQTMLGMARLQDQLGEKVARLYTYARMRKDEDNSNAVYQALSDRSESLMVETRSAVSFVVPEIVAIPEATLNQFMATEPELQVYRFFLEDLIRRKPHTLSAAEERIVAMTGEIGASARNVFTMLNNADIRFPNVRDEEGHEVELTKGRYVQFMESRDRRVRKEAFETLYGTYNKQRNTLASLLMSSVKKDIFNARVRDYPSALEASLDDNKIPTTVYHNLIATVREHNHLMHRYVRLRRRALGYGDLHMYDLYTPIVGEVDMKVPYNEARETVARGLAPLGADYNRVLQDGMRGGWIDVMENRGKTSGAYSWGAYPTHPYVLLNYQDTLDNMFTLAHEMGHAMHTWYTFKTQPNVYSDYTIFVAEVASTLNEMLLLEHMLKTVTDKNERLYLLNHYLEQFRGTVFRQTMFAEFEFLVHDKVEKGEALGADALSALYHKLNVEYYGPDIEVDQEIAMEWARIPHFYTAYYVYQYATGFSAAAALSQQILKEGQPAVDRYIRFLSSGGSDYPINLLRDAGVDMSSPEPIRLALQVFERVLVEMEELMGK